MMSDNEFNQLSLHDSLSLGEVELGLENDQNRPCLEEIHRLPLLLRLLSNARPLSAIPSFEPTTSNKTDELINEAVARLEDVAATYSAAEGVDVVTCHLAPSICRRISRLHPLQQKGGTANTSATWATQELSAVAENPRDKDKRQVGDRKTDEKDGALSIDSAPDSAPDSANEEIQDNELRPSKRQRKASTGEAASEDSLEATVTKTLSELSTLVVSSLEPIRKGFDDQEVAGKGHLSLSIEDSILSEARQSSTVDSIGSVSAGCDLGSTVSALMHHAPVLRHRHVANALCRAAIPEAANLIARMGANCPSGVQNLLRGCIEAYTSANEASPRNVVISNVARTAAKALGELSGKEQSRVRTTLQYSGVMVDVQLDLAIQHDPIAAACLLVQHLSASNTKTISARGIAMDGRHTTVNETSSDVAAQSRFLEDKYPVQIDPFLLENILDERPPLLHATIQCLQKELATDDQKEDFCRNWGEVSLLLSAYSWLFFCVNMEAILRSKKHGSTSVVAVIPALCSLAEDIQEHAKKSRPIHRNNSPSFLEKPYNLLLCASLLTLARLVSCDDLVEEDDISSREACEICLQDLLNYSSLISPKSDVVVSRFAFFLKNQDVDGLQNLVEEMISVNCNKSRLDGANRMALNKGLLKTCQWGSKNLPLNTMIDKGTTKESFGVDQSGILELFQNEHPIDEAMAIKIRHALKSLIMVEDGPAKTIALFHSTTVPDFIVKATSFLAKQSGKPNIPIISSLQIESLGSKVNQKLRRNETTELDSHEYEFLLQLLYWLTFVDNDPSSPFTFDLRTLPLKEAINRCEGFSSNNNLIFPLGSRIYGMIEKHFPEVALQAKRWNLQRHAKNDFLKKAPSFTCSKNHVQKALSLALRSCATTDSKTCLDPNGLSAERIFLLARRELTDAQLSTTVASTLLASAHSPLPAYTYSMLCRDPLVLLKCPIRVWSCRGIRHILLSVVFLLLQAHNAIVVTESPTSAGADDLISCRNVILLRCILAAATGTQSENEVGFAPISCPMVNHFVRQLVAGNRGLVAMLVKQGLPDAALDWIVEYVPETMDDSQALNNILLEQGTITAAEKLTAADAIVRIAVAHGDRDVIGTEALVYAALSQLVASFFLVVGPVGVPVNALVGEGSGLDITQVSRKATFRMLKSVLRVRGRRTKLRNECSLALQKLAGLCKGESMLSGVAGAVVSRRKNLLREIYDAVTKAANTMGSGIDV